MNNILKIQGNISGRTLAAAMIKAQAVTPGNLARKQAAGAGIFKGYLGENSARAEAWKQQTPFPPEAVLARASLSGNWLRQAGQFLENTTDPEERRALLRQIIDPHWETRLFGVSIGKEVASEIDIRQLEAIFEPKLPEIELEMIKIPGGKFKMGNEKERNERPMREVTLSAYLIEKYEVTNEQYGIFISQTGHRQPKSWDDPEFGKEQYKNPVVGIDYDDQIVCARWQARTLPTEARWEYAARGPEGRIYPWGDDWDPARATFNTAGTRPVDAHPEGASPFGVMDMAGNVWERLLDFWGAAYDPQDLKDPRGPMVGTDRVLRGGSWYINDPRHLRGANRDYINPEFRHIGLGFRLAEDLD